MASQISLFLRLCLLSLLVPSGGTAEECDDSKCTDGSTSLSTSFGTAKCCHIDENSDEEMDQTSTCSAGYKWERKSGGCGVLWLGYAFTCCKIPTTTFTTATTTTKRARTTSTTSTTTTTTTTTIQTSSSTTSTSYDQSPSDAPTTRSARVTATATHRDTKSTTSTPPSHLTSQQQQQEESSSAFTASAFNGTGAAISKDSSNSSNSSSSSSSSSNVPPQRSGLGPGYIAVIAVGMMLIVVLLAVAYKMLNSNSTKQNQTNNVPPSLVALQAHARSPNTSARANGAAYEVAVRDNPSYAPGDGMALVRSSVSRGRADVGSVGMGSVYAVPMEHVQLDAGGYVYDHAIGAQQMHGASSTVAYATPAAAGKDGHGGHDFGLTSQSSI